jgi:hypothetical protein
MAAHTAVEVGDPRLDQAGGDKPSVGVRRPPCRIAVLLVYPCKHLDASNEVAFGSLPHRHGVNV